MKRRIALIAILLALAACAPLYAKDSNTHVTVAEEIEMGREVAPVLRKKLGPAWSDAAAYERVQRIGNRLVAVSDRKEVAKLRSNYSFELVDTKAINAMALPGGTMFVTRGLMELGLSDDELAAVLGHEVAHAARRHGAKNIEASRIWQDRINARTKRNTFRMLGKVFVLAYLRKRLDPKLEFESDYYGMVYASRAGFDPDGMTKLFERFEKMEKSGGGSKWSRILSGLLDNHPPTAARLQRTRDLAARLKKGEQVSTTAVPIYE